MLLQFEFSCRIRHPLFTFVYFGACEPAFLQLDVAQTQASRDFALEDVMKLSTSAFLDWAKSLVDADGEMVLQDGDVAVLQKNRIKGSHLPTLTVEELERIGLPLGTAKSLVVAVQKMLGTANLTKSALLILPDSHTVSRLWQTLLKGEVKFMRRKKIVSSAGRAIETEEVVESSQDTGAFVLPQGMNWLHQVGPDVEKRGHSLFVRPCSGQICDLIDQHRRNLRLGAVVIGTPGIGKSWLSNLLLLRAAKEKRNVIFESVREDIAYFFEGATGTVRFADEPRAGRSRPWPFANDRNTLYIMDAGGKGVHREPLGVSAFTVVLASPNEKHYGQFLKEIGFDSRFFMPDWTLDDLKAVLPFVEDREFKNVATDAVVEERYGKIGGVPRSVFGTQQGFDDAVSMLEQSLTSLSRFDLSILDSKDTNWHLVPNFVFTLRSTHPFGSRNTFVARASRYVEEYLFVYLDEVRAKELEDFSRAYDGR